mmetsp:Transcript_17050/g.46753  ORF Transcript_17050/g.46753 Transcript_17050/m.46753 type:complete len:217 (+) Transcript_17050:57-707(+)
MATCLSTVCPGIICSVCLDVFRKPVSLLACQHTFCRCCILEHFEREQLCPLCRLKTRGKDDLVENRLLREIISNLQDFVAQTSREHEQLEMSNQSLVTQLSETESDLTRVVAINQSLTTKLSKAQTDVQRLKAANHTLSTELLQSESPLNQHEVLMADLDRLVAANHSLSTELLSSSIGRSTDGNDSGPDVAPTNKEPRRNKLQKVLKAIAKEIKT